MKDMDKETEDKLFVLNKQYKTELVYQGDLKASLKMLRDKILIPEQYYKDIEALKIKIRETEALIKSSENLVVIIKERIARLENY